NLRCGGSSFTAIRPQSTGVVWFGTIGTPPSVMLTLGAKMLATSGISNEGSSASSDAIDSVPVLGPKVLMSTPTISVLLSPGAKVDGKPLTSRNPDGTLTDAIVSTPCPLLVTRNVSCAPCPGWSVPKSTGVA